MRKRKMIVIITTFVVFILGIGCFALIKGLGKTSVSDEQKHKSIQVSNARSSDNQRKISTINKREINKKEVNTPNNPPNAISATSSVGNEGPSSISTSISISGNSNMPNDEEKRKLIEEQDKHSMELMHEHGWYKPEDIPITYAKPQEPNTPVGAYIWKTVEGVANPKKRSPEVKAKNRETFELIKATLARGDGREAIKIGQELLELNRPYQPLSVRVKIHLELIPSVWSKYFVDLANTEQQEIFEEENRQ